MTLTMHKTVFTKKNIDGLKNVVLNSHKKARNLSTAQHCTENKLEIH